MGPGIRRRWMSKKGESSRPDLGRGFQSADEDFLADLGPSLSPRHALTALAIRSAIAEFAELPAASVAAHHTFAEDLAGRGMFDSLDTVEFIMVLEEKLGGRIPGGVAEGLVGLNKLDFPHPFFTVADLVIPMTLYLVDAGIM